MQLTPKELTVVQRLRRQRVATMKTLRQQLAVSHMTVARALRKYGYYTSVNHNASFYTLHDVPRFDEHGLWTYRDICFSQHRCLDKTLVNLVENAPAGQTVAELEQQVHAKAANLLSRLCRQKRLSRYLIGRVAVYVSIDDQRQQQQRAERDRRQHESQHPLASSESKQPTYPPGWDVVLVLEVLIQVIKTPQADADGLAKALRTRGIEVRAANVQRVLEFYAIKKKRHDRRR
jgi:hypothetical protein